MSRITSRRFLICRGTLAGTLFSSLLNFTASAIFILASIFAPVLRAQRAIQPLSSLPEDVVLKKDLVYATVGSRELHLDLFLPKAGSGPFPAIVYFNGWGQTGEKGKQQFYRQAAYMAEKGFAGACVEYRIAGESTYPAAIYDAKAAVRWIRANAPNYHIDQNRIGAAGGSGGGFVVSMLGTTIDMPEFEGKEGNAGISSRVSAVVAFNPVTNWIEYEKNFEKNGSDKPHADPTHARDLMPEYLGGTYVQNPEVWKAASPIYHVSAHSTPFLIWHGDADTNVPYQQSVEMVEKLRGVGVSAEIFIAPGAGHGYFNLSPWFDPALKRMDEFFERTLRAR